MLPLQGGTASIPGLGNKNSQGEVSDLGGDVKGFSFHLGCPRVKSPMPAAPAYSATPGSVDGISAPSGGYSADIRGANAWKWKPQGTQCASYSGGLLE